MMKKKLTNTLLILISAFAFTSCGDSKESVTEDMVSLLEETAEATKSGNKDALAEIEEKGKALEERMKAVGIDMKDPETWPSEIKEKIEKIEEIEKEALKEASKLRTRIPEDTKKALDKAKIEAKRMLREAGKE